MQLRFASYNIHKAVGLDRRRDPERILRILLEMDADIVALQEVDRRYGRRMAVLPLDAIHAATDYVPVPLSMKPDSLGWHGNALLVKKGIALVEAAPVALPTLEPRGAVRADLDAGGVRVRVVGMHLDLSGLRRRQQVRRVLETLEGCGTDYPSVLMGDFNEWSSSGCFREFDASWRVLAPGRSFPSRRPMAPLDRIIISKPWRIIGTNVHRSALSAIGSDHLPVMAHLELPKK
ncbi:endonuclease/exonuclease/phosphatase family protein [Novosphingobium sp. 1949]|uniref:Endonuclease/exonuclease/phosphatase family protein n=1 Tax=Novosphingobium organovorum TaxID=2930092 RepID=A0ABT0BI92_9SPHN|nr:endonuclease/exonuclease/phosphatase family protein [Novosphingobium organovorum]MCJ2184781.1 endonuclease/exonuclease/phosphatase family protein [Novosphingobium organovorum]